MTVAGGGVKLQVEVLIALPNLGKREVPLVSFGYFAAWSPDRVYNLGVRRKSSNDVVFRAVISKLVWRIDESSETIFFGHDWKWNSFRRNRR